MNSHYHSPAVLEGDDLDEVIEWPGQKRRITGRLVVLGVIAGLVLLVSGYVIRQYVEVRRVSPPPPPLCGITKGDVRAVQDLLLQGQSGGASAIAHADLAGARGSGCTATVRARLALVAYQADLDLLLAQPCTLGDVPGEQSRIAGWHKLSDFARQNHLPAAVVLGPRTMEQEAYNLGCFAWARQAFLAGWAAGDYRSAVEDAVSHYTAVLFNLGNGLVRYGPASQRIPGLRLLALSAAIAHKWALPRGEARARLSQLLGPDSRHWPRPTADPLLGR
jgi:hypothetical protein